jgi:sec-independent protein translocase protein TatA
MTGPSDLLTGSGPYLAFGLPGGMELWIILLITLLLFGSKLPSVARNIGRSFTEFKRGVKGEDDGEEKFPKVGREEGPAQLPGSGSEKEKTHA